MKTYLKSILAIIMIAFCACEKDPTFRVLSINDNATKVSNITATSAEVIVSIFETESGDHYNYNDMVLEVYYSTSSNPFIESYKIARCTTVYAGHTIRLYNLEPGTTYYYAPKLGNQYGKVREFTTLLELTATTGNYSNLTAKSVQLEGSAVINDGGSLAELGILVRLNNSDVTIDHYDHKECNSFSLSSGQRTVSKSFSGLYAESTYYYRAYAKGKGRIYYGEVKSFKTLTKSTRSAKTAVDLGLSVKWAAGNVGATDETDYGDYFAWGETSPKSVYNWDTYKYMRNGDWLYITKYTAPDGQTSGIWYNASGKFIGDNKTTLDLTDDAARQNWGGTWRMPTKAEINELINNCTWTWTQKDGINGYAVKGPNGNSIFLPASGSRLDSSLNLAGSHGCYWSSSLYNLASDEAEKLSFDSGFVGWYGYGGRYYGRPVRPVCQ